MKNDSLVSLVTGGIGDIGRAIVDEFLARGDRVIIFDCVDDDDEKVTALRSRGVDYMQVDLRFVDQIKKAFSKIYERYGSIDVLVNNAGITRDGMALRMNESDWDDVHGVNLRGAFFCAQQALSKMIRNKKSYILNMSSIVGIAGNPGQVNYASSKAGLIAMTKTLAKEYGKRGGRVNAMAPGFIQTAMTSSLSEDLKKEVCERTSIKLLGTPGDVARLAAFLTSGFADYITGQVITVDGGML
jgi:3-oxoacyl-[acyl-carrier protein] reductase